MATQTQTASILHQSAANSVSDGRNTNAGIITKVQLTNGTNVDQADKAYYASITLAGAAYPSGLDFVGGGLIDLNGDTISWAELVYLEVKASSANTVNVVVGAHASPIEFGCGANSIFVKPGETKTLICHTLNPAYPLTGGSADTLKLAIASGVNQVIEVFAIGRSV